MKKCKILVIEDTESIREELKEILTFEGMHPINTKNGQQIIAKAKAKIPTRIL